MTLVVSERVKMWLFSILVINKNGAFVLFLLDTESLLLQIQHLKIEKKSGSVACEA